MTNLIKPTSFTKFQVIFQHGSTTFFDHVISSIAGAPVHAELLFNGNISYSASDAENGKIETRFVDFNKINLPNRKWKFVDLDPSIAEAAFDFCVAKQGCPYDYYGIALGWTYNCRPSPTRWFCSEVCAAALIYADPLLLKSQLPQYYTPRRLELELITPKIQGLLT